MCYQAVNQAEVAVVHWLSLYFHISRAATPMFQWRSYRRN